MESMGDTFIEETKSSFSEAHLIPDFKMDLLFRMFFNQTIDESYKQVRGHPTDNKQKEAEIIDNFIPESIKKSEQKIYKELMEFILDKEDIFGDLYSLDSLGKPRREEFFKIFMEPYLRSAGVSKKNKATAELELNLKIHFKKLKLTASGNPDIVVMVELDNGEMVPAFIIENKSFINDHGNSPEKGTEKSTNTSTGSTFTAQPTFEIPKKLDIQKKYWAVFSQTLVQSLAAQRKFNPNLPMFAFFTDAKLWYLLYLPPKREPFILFRLKDSLKACLLMHSVLYYYFKKQQHLLFMKTGK